MEMMKETLVKAKEHRKEGLSPLLVNWKDNRLENWRDYSREIWREN